MKVSDEMLEEYVAYRKIARKLGALFQFSEAELFHPHAADWLEDVIKQYQTAFIAMKAVKMRQSDNLKVENYHTPINLPPKPSTIEGAISEDLPLDKR